MTFSVLNLDIDGSVAEQRQLKELIDVTVDLRKLEDKLRLWSLPQQVRSLRQKFQVLRQKHPQKWLTFYGSGDLNHLSALLIETLPESAKPVNLVLFDNHPDWFTFLFSYHCGNWVGTLLKLDWIESVTLIGQDSDDLDGHNFWLMPRADLESGRVSIYPYRRKRTSVPFLPLGDLKGVKASRKDGFNTGIEFDTVAELGLDGVANLLSKKLAGKNVYIAIDKDVLNEDDAQADWEQGQLPLPQLITLTNSIFAAGNVVGVDVCGERAPRSLRGLFKRIDAGRFGKKNKFDERVNVINEKANLAIVKAVTKRAIEHDSKSLC